MVKAKTRANKDKGGCLVGKKEKTTKGGCKVGRKGVNFKVKNKGNPTIYKTNKATGKIEEVKKKKEAHAKQIKKTAQAVQKVKQTAYKAQLEKTKKAVQKVKDTKAALKAKPKSAGAIEAARIKAKIARKKATEMKPKKKVGARVVNKKPSSGIAKIPPKEAKGVEKSKAEKKARIQQKVRDLGKAQIAKKKEKKKDFTAPAKQQKPKEPKKTAGESLTGLTAAQMNAMSPAELFGKLPVRVASGVVLNPKRTGVKVAQDPRKAYEEASKSMEEKREALRGKVEELTEKYKEELIAKKLKVPALKIEMKKINFGGGYNKGQMIKILAEQRAEKDSGFKELGDKIFVANVKERGRLKKAEEDKVDREIEEARKNPKKPTEKEIDAFRLDLARHGAARRQMRGSAYAEGNRAAEKRLHHRYRNIFAYREKHGSQYIDSVMAGMGTPRGYEFQ